MKGIQITKSRTFISNTCLSGPSSSIFDSDGGWWEEGATYAIKVTVAVGSRPGVTISRSVYVNFKPYDGTCSVNPVEGW